MPAVTTEEEPTTKTSTTTDAPTARTSSTATPGTGLRSPNYPITDIEEAIERVKKVYKAIRIGTQSYDFVAKSMGYKGVNGASRVMTSTLKKFGLLEDGGKDGLKVSEEAKAIIMLPASDARHLAAVKVCALRPQIFAELYSTYGFDLPDDKPLQFFLVNKKFVPEVAIDVARNFRRTMEFLMRLDPNMQTQTESGGDAPEVSEADAVANTQKQQAPHANEQRTAPMPNSSPQPSFATTPMSAVDASLEIHAKLFGDCKAHILIEGTVTKKSIEKLGRILAAYAEDYEQEEAKPAPVSKSKKTQPAPHVDEEETLDLYEGEDEEDEE